MGKPTDGQLARKFLGELEADGTPRSNTDLRNSLGWKLETYLKIKELLIDQEKIRKARGRGGAVARVKSKGQLKVARQGDPLARRRSARTRSRVFVTHGHNSALRTQVVDLLERVNLDPVVLESQPNDGRTVVEKFETHANVAAAVVIMTGDDVGGKAGEDAKPRARQNVLLELGYFLGKLGRERVVLLHDGEAEIPSNLAGVLTVRSSQDWRISLLRELRRTVPISGTLDALLDQS